MSKRLNEISIACVRDCSGNPFCLFLAKRLERKARPPEVKMLPAKFWHFLLQGDTPKKLFVIYFYNGILPCFFLGSLSTLFSSILNALINFKRVSFGSITSSIKPRSAAR